MARIKRFFKRLFKPKEKVKVADNMEIIFQSGGKTWRQH